MNPLDYASPQAAPRWSGLAITSLLAGVFSGPIGVLLFMADTQDGVALIAASIVGSLAIGIVGIRAARPSKRGRPLAVAGIIVALLWPVVLYGWFVSEIQKGGL